MTTNWFEDRHVEGDVDVVERGLHGDDDEPNVERRLRKAEREQRHQDQRPRHDDVDHMQPRTGQPVEGARGVVNGVERPEPADSVEGAVHRVLREVGDQHDGEDFDGQRQNRRIEPGDLACRDRATSVAGSRVKNVSSSIATWLTRK